MELVAARALRKTFQPDRKRPSYAVRGVSLSIRKGETLGLVGESGCGKSTLGKMLLKLEQPTGGRVVFDGRDITDFSFDAMRAIRNRMQMVFQGNADAFNPYFTVRQTVGEPLDNYARETDARKTERVLAMLEKVGLDATHLTRRPRELSGGQRQRVGIARALVLEPEFVVCDEVVSSIDYALKRRILDLFSELKASMGLTYLFISHDIAAVNAVSDRVAVMYLGVIVEIVPKTDGKALHPYTRALLAAVLTPDPRKRGPLPALSGAGEEMAVPERGCVFQSRCPSTRTECKTDHPELRDVGGGRHVACHLYATI